jgi:hypothetical protein
MVARLEYLGEDGWEQGFDINPGDDGALLDQGPDGKENLYFIKCERDNSCTWVYQLVEGQYRWVSPSKFEICETIEPTAVLNCGTGPYETTIFEAEGKHRRAIQITHKEV